MEASVAAPDAPVEAIAPVETEQPAAAPVPDASEPAPEPQAAPATPGTVHLIDGKAVNVSSIESVLEQMVGDAGELWVTVEQEAGKVISFLKSAVVAHE